MIAFNTGFSKINSTKLTTNSQIEQKNKYTHFSEDTFEKSGMPQKPSFGMGNESLKKNSLEFIKAKFDLDNVEKLLKATIKSSHLTKSETENLQAICDKYVKAAEMKKFAQKNAERAERVFVLENQLKNTVRFIRKSQDPEETRNWLAELKEIINDNADDLAEDFIDVANIRAGLKAKTSSDLSALLKTTDFLVEDDGTITAVLKNAQTGKYSQTVIIQYGRFISQYVKKLIIA